MESNEIEGESSPNPNVFRILTSDTPKRSDPALVPDPSLKNGRILPKRLQQQFKELNAFGKPVEDIDPHYENGKTFAVISSNFRLFRYSSHHTLFLFDPLNTLRRFFIFILTHWIYSAIMTAIVVADFILTSDSLLMPRSVLYSTRPVFLVIYLAEFFMKWISMGFVMSPFTYLRSFWSWIDMFVILDYIFLQFTHFHFTIFNSAYVILKVIPYRPGLHQAFDFCLSCVLRLKELIIGSLAIMSVLTILGVQMYMAVLTQKCIRDFDHAQLNISEDEFHKQWNDHTSNSSNWYNPYQAEALLCGNSSGADTCPTGYTCLQGFGKSPNYGYTNFDNFFWGFLQVLRLVSQDFTELIIQQIFRTASHSHMVYFLLVMFFGTFGIGTFAYAVVAHTFLEMKDTLEENDNSQDQNCQNESCFFSRLFPSWSFPPGFNSFRRQIHCFLFHPFSEVCITCIIILDVILLIANIEQPIFRQIFCWIYVLEFLVKIFAESPKDYFVHPEHILDFFVVVTFIVFLFVDHALFSSFIVMRMFKLFPRWPSLNFLIQSLLNSLKNYGRFFVLLLVVMLMNACKGVVLFQLPAGEDYPSWLPPEARWNFKDFQHSFMMVFRVACGEWIESLWDTMLYSGTGVVYFIAILLIMYLLITVASVAIVVETGETFSKIEFQENPLYTKFEEGLKRICVPVTWLRSKINPGGQTHNILEEVPIHRQSQLMEETNGESPVPDSGDRSQRLVDKLMGNKYYNAISIVVILWCSFILVVDDVYNEYVPDTNTTKEYFAVELDKDKPIPEPSIFKMCIFYSDIIFTIYVGIDILLKLFFYLLKKEFVSCAWIFDLLLIVEMIFNLTMYAPFTSPLHGYFNVKCFRLFMLVSRVDRLQAVFNGLCKEFSIMWKYLLAACFVLLTFDVQGIHIFQNRFGKCVDFADDSIIDSGIISNISECNKNNFTWTNSYPNYDNALNGVRAMFTLMTVNGWLTVLHSGVDSRYEMYQQPIRDYNYFYTFYFVFAMTFGVFFLGYILLGILIHFLRTDQLKGIFMTFDQFYEYKNSARQFEGTTHLTQGENTQNAKVPAPNWKFLKFFYDVVENPFFDKFIMTCICLQFITLAFDHYGFNATFEVVFDVCHMVIVVIYTIEMVLKLLGWRYHYFKSVFNRVDFAIVILFTMGLVLSDFPHKYLISPVLFSLVRIFRIFKFEPFQRRAVLSQKFLNAFGLVRSALLNIFLFLLINLFSFSLMFMAMFKDVKLRAALDSHFNFKTFGGSLSILFQMATFGGWDSFFEGLADENDCNLPDPDHNIVGDCGSSTKASVMTFSYLSMSVLLVMNIYIVFILEIVKRFSENESKREQPPRPKENNEIPDINVQSSSANAGASSLFEIGNANANSFTDSFT